MPIRKGFVGSFANELVENLGYLGRLGRRLLGDFVIDFGLLISDTFIKNLSFDRIRLCFRITDLLLFFLFACNFGSSDLFY